jgi:hypothetical protein
VHFAFPDLTPESGCQRRPRNTNEESALRSSSVMMMVSIAYSEIGLTRQPTSDLYSSPGYTTNARCGTTRSPATAWMASLISLHDSIAFDIFVRARSRATGDRTAFKNSRGTNPQIRAVSQNRCNVISLFAINSLQKVSGEPARRT